jgi:hypothetical protein
MAVRPYYGAGGYTRETEVREDGEGRRRKTGTRRTVDYGCTNAKWIAERLCQRSPFDEIPMRPNLNEVINVYSLHSLMADASKCGVQEQSRNISDAEIRPHLDQQNQTSCECCQGIPC